MDLTSYELLEALNKYFSKTNNDLELLILLGIPFLMIALLIMFLRGLRIKHNDFSEILSDKDYEFIEIIRQTKKLEEFDRDLLIELSIQSKMKPIYLAFIDKQSFLNIEADLAHKLKKDGRPLSDNPKHKALRAIRKKLF